MKKIFFFLSITVLAAVVLTACNSKGGDADAVARMKAYQDSIKFAADTAGLSQFQAWKAQNELTDAEMMGQTAPAMAASNNAPRTSSATRTRSSSGSGVRRSSSSGGTASAPAKKKGWSKAAKGATIGGVAGAVGGAVINKRNRVVGGVVGGIIGAGVGYGIGRSQDKKDGRY